MLNYIWPMALILLSNFAYHLSTKSAPESMHPLASLTVTYAIGAVVSFVLYYVLNRDANILHEYAKLNFAPFMLGLAVVGLEVGYIYAYKAGWAVSTAQVVQSVLLAILLIGAGYLLWKEPITWNKVAGIVVCLAGLGLIGLK